MSKISSLVSVALITLVFLSCSSPSHIEPVEDKSVEDTMSLPDLSSDTGDFIKIFRRLSAIDATKCQQELEQLGYSTQSIPVDKRYRYEFLKGDDHHYTYIWLMGRSTADIFQLAASCNTSSADKAALLKYCQKIGKGYTMVTEGRMTKGEFSVYIYQR
jgi:hypothetical protein